MHIVVFTEWCSGVGRESGVAQWTLPLCSSPSVNERAREVFGHLAGLGRHNTVPAACVIGECCPDSNIPKATLGCISWTWRDC